MKAITIPDPIRQALEDGATLSISVSGGKDSQAMLIALVEAHREHEWSGEIYAIHADLGRAEWGHFDPESPFNTLANVKRQCEELGVQLVIVERPQGDMIARWRQRMEDLDGSGKPFWSSATNRYCTAELKRDQIDKHLRTHDHVVCAMGIRADESGARAKKAGCSVRSQITTSRGDVKKAEAWEALDLWEGQERKGRLALDWLPIHEWTVADVFERIGHSMEDLGRRKQLYGLGAKDAALDGWKAHPAYVTGNDRLSCALCVLASRDDLVNGARHNPDTWELMYRMEVESGFTFRQDISLGEIGVEAGLISRRQAELNQDQLALEIDG